MQPGQRLLLRDDPRRPLGIDQAVLVGERGEAKVGVVVPEKQAVLGAAREHPIRLRRSLGHEIVDQHADVGIRAGQRERRLPQYLEGGIRSGYQPLCGRLLVAGRPIDLSGEIKTRNPLRFERVGEAGSAGKNRIRPHNRAA